MSGQPGDTQDTHGLAVEYLTILPRCDEIGAHRIATFMHILKHVVSPSRRSLLDLGAGHCKFGIWATRLGFEVTAVDGRTARLPADLGAIRFVQADVRDYDPRGHGVVAILGLLYHLELADQESLLRRCREDAPVIVETQVHVPPMVADHPRDWHRPVTRGGYCGVDFPEADNPMASIGNRTSFWHTEPSMLRLFARAGYARALVIDPVFASAYGARRFYVLTP